MKKVFLFGFLFIVVSLANGDLILEEGMESGFPPDGWSVETTHEGTTPSGYSYTWQADMYYSHNGLFSAMVYGSMDGQPQDELLLSPAIDLSGYSSASITFWTYGYDWGDSMTDLTFEIAEDNSTGLVWNTLWSYPMFLTTWEMQTVDLSAYAGLIIRLGWRLTFAVSPGSERGDIVNLDDISLQGTPGNDDTPDDDDDNDNDDSTEDDDVTDDDDNSGDDDNDDDESNCCG